MHIRFDQRHVLITGAAQGIGRAIAQCFQDAGAQIHLTDVDAEGLQRAASALGVEGTPCDLSNREAVQALAATVLKRTGMIDVLVNAAGGVRGQVGRPIEEIAEDDWRAIFAANIDSAFWLAQAFAPSMKAARQGRIVLIASGAGLRPSLTGIQAYTSAKHAVVGLTRQLALEFGPYGINVNAIAPGLVISNPSTERQWESYGPEGQKRLVESLHLRRLGSAADIAQAALFMASDQANWITGQILSVDGGRA